MKNEKKYKYQDLKKGPIIDKFTVKIPVIEAELRASCTIIRSLCCLLVVDTILVKKKRSLVCVFTNIVLKSDYNEEKMFRDRTNLFFSYRRTFPHNTPYQKISSNTFGIDETDGVQNENDMFNISSPTTDDPENFPMLDMQQSNDVASSRSSIFIEYANEIDENLLKIDKLMDNLSKLYRKNALPGFEDKSFDEREIEEISYKITTLYQNCYNIIKRLQFIFNEQQFENKKLNKGELIVLDNLQKNYAFKIQNSSNKFRVLQNNYLKFLNKDDLKPILPKKNNITSSTSLKDNDSDNFLLIEEEAAMKDNNNIEDYSRRMLQKQSSTDRSQNYLEQRDEEIKNLAKGVLEVSMIFREMQSLIVDQGTIVDRIDYNLENTVINLKDADKELTKATHYQKSTQKCKLIMLLVLCVMAVFFFIMLKPHGGKTVVKYKNPNVVVDHSTTTITSQLTTASSPTIIETPIIDEGVEDLIQTNPEEESSNTSDEVVKPESEIQISKPHDEIEEENELPAVVEIPNDNWKS